MGVKRKKIQLGAVEVVDLNQTNLKRMAGVEEVMNLSHQEMEVGVTQKDHLMMEVEEEVVISLEYHLVVEVN